MSVDRFEMRLEPDDISPETLRFGRLTRSLFRVASKIEKRVKAAP